MRPPHGALLSLILIVAAASGPAGRVTRLEGREGPNLRITVSTPARPGTSATIAAYTLACYPVGGTLPLAKRVCADIAKYPQPMLHPLAIGHWECGGMPFAPSIEVSGTADGTTISLRGLVGACLPNGVGTAVFAAAAKDDTTALTRLEFKLRCDLPAMRQATGASLVACMRALWTPRSEELIRESEHAAVLAPLHAERLFPPDVGTAPCPIATGRPAGKNRRLTGLCEVTEKNIWSGTPTVTFTEEWPIGADNLLISPSHARHSWEIVVANGSPSLESQVGVRPPQMRR
jgi:hypothetical protein